MITRIASILIIALSCACDAGHRPGLLREPDAAPAEVRSGCAIAARRCSRCHPLDRLDTRVATPAGWQTYVRRMRLTPGSGIPPAEEPAIVRCVVFRAFGTAGLQQLTESVVSP